MGSKIWNFKLKILELSWLHHSIRLEKCIIFVPKNFKIRKNWPSYAHVKFGLKSGSWPIFGLLLGFLATTLNIWTLFLFCPSFRSRLMGKPIFRPNGAILAILSPKNPQKTLKWPYLKTRFCPNCNHQKAYSSFIFQSIALKFWEST